MTRAKHIARPDLEIPVEAWGTIKSATAKLAWFAQVDVAIAAGMVGGSFAQLAINIATNPKGVNSQTGLTWRSARTLADDTGLTKSTVDRLLKEAVAAGLLFVVREGRPGRDGQSTMFRLAMPEGEIAPPVGHFPRKKRPTHGTKNHKKRPTHDAGNVPSGPQETSHLDRNKRPISGTHLLRDITPSDLTPLERGSAAQSARVERGNVTETETTVSDAPLNPAFDTVDAAPVPEPLTPVPRADARTEPVALQKQPPPSGASKNIGRPVMNGADADADVERAAVLDHGRNVLGAGFDALTARLLDAERALDALDAAQRVLDALDAAANEDDPHAHIENEIAVTLHVQATHQ
ncbi:hypothetical protein AB4853_25510 [Bradyrhizobium sp. 1050_B9_N1_2]|uniref:hypothetical protein n=1 Tax=Bradyrhizobium sp. 1050_B9_N1_2 TaxID=3238688 RepID=UPI003EDC1EA7